MIQPVQLVGGTTSIANKEAFVMMKKISFYWITELGIIRNSSIDSLHFSKFYIKPYLIQIKYCIIDLCHSCFKCDEDIPIPQNIAGVTLLRQDLTRTRPCVLICPSLSLAPKHRYLAVYWSKLHTQSSHWPQKFPQPCENKREVPPGITAA